MNVTGYDCFTKLPNTAMSTIFLLLNYHPKGEIHGIVAPRTNSLIFYLAAWCSLKYSRYLVSFDKLAPTSILFSGLYIIVLGKFVLIPKPELRGMLKGFPYCSQPFGVTSSAGKGRLLPYFAQKYGSQPPMRFKHLPVQDVLRPLVHTDIPFGTRWAFQKPVNKGSFESIHKGFSPQLPTKPVGFFRVFKHYPAH